MPTSRVPPNVSPNFPQLQLPPETSGEIEETPERGLVLADAIEALRGQATLMRARAPQPVALDATLERINDAVRTSGVPSLGAEGEIRKVVVAIPLHVIYAEETHPRTDWQTQDQAFMDLRKSINEDRQLDPLVVTFLTPEDESVPPGYLVRLVDGFRRLAVMRDLGRGSALCRVELDERTGQPLSRAQQLYYWINVQRHNRALKMPQLVYALAQLQAAAGGELPDQRTAAIQTGVSKGTIGRAYAILEEPHVIVEAVAQQLLPAEVALQLPQILTDEAARVAFVQKALRSPTVQQREVSVRQFLAEAERLRPALPATSEHGDDLAQRLSERLMTQARALLATYDQCREHEITLPSALSEALRALATSAVRRELR